MSIRYSGLSFDGTLALNKETQPDVVWVYPVVKTFGPYASDDNPSRDVDITFHAVAYNTTEPLFYSVSVGAIPDGLTLDSGSGQMTGTLTVEEGLLEFTIRASILDAAGSYAERPFRMVVGNALPPIWVTPAGLMSLENEMTSFTTTLLANDPYELPVKYFLVGGQLPPGLNLNFNTGVIQGEIADIDDDTEYTFTVSASNNSRASQRTFSIYVVTTPPGDAAYWVTPSGSVGDRYELTDYNFTFLAIDPNALPITYVRVAGNIPNGLTLEGPTGIMQGTFGEQPDDTQFKMILGARTSVFTTKRMFTLSVRHVVPPNFGEGGDLPLELEQMEDTFFETHALSATSETPLPIIYTATNMPSSLQIDISNGYVSGTMPHLLGQNDLLYNMTITASNGLKSTNRTFILTNLKNVPPVFSLENGEISAALGGAPYTSPAPWATDPNGYPVTYVLNNLDVLPSSLTFDANTGIISGTYPAAPLEDVITTFDLTASDGVHTANAVYTIRSWLNTPPVWTTAAGPLGTTVENYDAEYTLTATDPQFEPITYSLVAGALPPGMTLVDNQIVGTAQPISDPNAESHTFTIRASDGILFTDRVFTITITKDFPPIWDTPSGIIVEELAGKAFTFTLVGHDPNLTTPDYVFVSNGGLPELGEGVALSEVQNGVTFNKTITGKLPQPVFSNSAEPWQDFNIVVGLDDSVNPLVTQVFTIRSLLNTPPIWDVPFANAFTVADTTANVALYKYDSPYVYAYTIDPTISDPYLQRTTAAPLAVEVSSTDPTQNITYAPYAGPTAGSNAVILPLIDAFEQQPVNAVVYATDLQAQEVYYHFSDSGSMSIFMPGVGDPLQFNSITGRVVGTLPTITEDSFVRFTVTAQDKTEQNQDNRYYGNRQDFLIAIRFNKPPVWVTPASLGRVETLSYSRQLVANNDGNLPQMEYSIVAGALPPNFTLTNTGVLAATANDVAPFGKVPSVDSDTPYQFTIRAWNGIKYTDQAFTFTIFENQAPVWITDNTTVIAEGLGLVPFSQQQGFLTQLEAADPNAAYDDPLIYRLISRGDTPKEMKFDYIDPFQTSDRSVIQFEYGLSDNRGFDWIPHGTPTFAAGRFGQGLVLDGSSYIETELALNLEGIPFTIDLWFKGHVGSLFTIGEEGLDGFNAYFDGDGYVCVDFLRVQLLKSDNPITDDNWHYMSIGRNGSSTIFLNVDGVINSEALPTTTHYLAKDLMIGSYTHAGSNQFVGMIDEFRVTRAFRNIGAPPTEAIGTVITGAISGNFPLVQNTATYNFTVSVSDSMVTVANTFTVRNLADQDPIWNTAEGVIGNPIEGYELNTYLSAIDPEQKSIQYTVVSGTLPFNLIESGVGAGTISGNAPVAADPFETYEFTIEASDGIHKTNRDFSIIVDHNFPPVWVTNTGIVASCLGGENIAPTQLVATDQNGTNVTFAVTGGALPSGITLSTAGMLTGQMFMAQADQDYDFTVTASDGVNTVDRDFTIRVLLNRAPRYTPTTGTQILSKFEQTQITTPIRIQIDDPDESEMHISLQPPNFPMVYHIEGQGTAHANVVITGGTLPAVQTDTIFQFTVLADDTVNFTTAQFPIRVVFNSPPEFTTSATWPHGVEQTPYNFIVNAVSNGANIFYSVSAGSLPAGLSLDPATGVVSGTAPLVDEDTVYNFSILATTGIKGTEQAVTLTIDKNEPPEWITDPTLTPVFEGRTIVPMNIVAMDPNVSQTLTFEWLDGILPTGIDYSLNSAPNMVVLTGNTPVVANTTLYTFRLGANDGFIRTDRTFTFTVKYNEPPVWVTAIGEIMEIAETTAIPNNTRVIATDGPGENATITYSIANVASWPSWLTLAPNGFLTGTTPSVSVDTRYNFEVAASDGYRSVSRPFSFFVKQTPHPPVWTTPAGVLQVGFSDDPVSIQLVATDSYYNGAVTYAVTNSSTLPSTLSLSSGGLLTGTLPLASGNTQNFPFSIDAINIQSEQTTRAFFVTSNKVNVLRATSPTGVSSLYGYDDKLVMDEVGEWTLEWLRDSKFDAKLWGAAGGAVNGGTGGFASGSHATVALNSTWKAWVGGGGRISSPSTTGYPGGFGNGGQCGRANTSNPAAGGPASGGGLTGLFNSTSISQATARIIAGAGGGGSSGAPAGGAGGGSSGLVGTNGGGNGGPGGPGTQVSGGAKGTDNNATGAQAGSQLTGGRGSTTVNDIFSGSGGGAGWFGGGGGGGNNTFGGGAGGGSGYIGGVTSGVLTVGSSGGGLPANSGDADYNGLAGKPIAANTPGGTSNGGLIVLYPRAP